MALAANMEHAIKITFHTKNGIKMTKRLLELTTYFLLDMTLKKINHHGFPK